MRRHLFDLRPPRVEGDSEEKGGVENQPRPGRQNAEIGKRVDFAENDMKLFREPVRPKTSPVLSLKLTHRKYESWKTFLDNAYWTVELK